MSKMLGPGFVLYRLNKNYTSQDLNCLELSTIIVAVFDSGFKGHRGCQDESNLTSVTEPE